MKTSILPPANERGWHKTPNAGQFVRTIPTDRIDEVLQKHYSNTFGEVRRAAAAKRPLVHAILSDSGKRSALLIQLPPQNGADGIRMLSETIGNYHAESTEDSCKRLRGLMRIMNLKIDLPL